MLDLHSHILPGYDDGAANLEQSLAMARMAVEDGIRGVVCTPHWSGTHPRNTRSRILDGVARLQQELATRSIPLKLFAGAELRLDPRLSAGIRAGKLMTLNDTGCFVLIELPDVFELESLQRFFWELQLRSITPIVGHPERNPAILRNPLLLYSIVKRGVLAQLTAASILGSFGREVEELSMLLLNHRMCHVLATDAHETHVRPPKLAEAFEAVSEIVGKEAAWDMVHKIPKRILGGGVVDVPDPIPIKTKSKLAKFFFWK